MTTTLMGLIVSDTVLDRAYAWLCERRKEYSANNDVWHLRWNWSTLKPQLQAELIDGRYRLGPLQRMHGGESSTLLWSAPDALVLKAVAIVLAERWAPDLSPRCYHLAGRGGAKAAVRAVADHLDEYTFVFRTDVKEYYANIEHALLFGRLAARIDDPRLLWLLSGYLNCTICDGGEYSEFEQGICRSCPLSPLMGALFLSALDDRMAGLEVFYARLQDDWVILVPTRWKLRTAIKLVNQTLAELKLEKHPDKTFIGRISHGFDFLGYRFALSGLGVAAKTVERFAERVSRLYEQGAGGVRIGEYVRRWLSWVQAGLGRVLVGIGTCGLKKEAALGFEVGRRVADPRVNLLCPHLFCSGL